MTPYTTKRGEVRQALWAAEYALSSLRFGGRIDNLRAALLEALDLVEELEEVKE